MSIFTRFMLWLIATDYLWQLRRERKQLEASIRREMGLD